MIHLSNISVTFSKNTALERKALQSLNLRINPKDFITVIGNNGAGKSTLQNVIAGNIPVDSGNIFIDEEEITNKSIHERSKNISRVFQNPTISTCAELTISENMSLAYQRGKSRNLKFAINKSNQEFFKSKLSELGMGLEDRMNEQVGTLSGGQRQALSLLMAIISSAKLLLLDEHTAALDPKMANKIMELTKKFHKQYDLTILMITHNIKYAFNYGNRTIMLKNGKVIRDLNNKERKEIDPATLLESY